jgi:hypothetical protein
MSAFRFKVSPRIKGGAQRAQGGRDMEKIYRMIANGSTEQHAYEVFAAKRARREAQRKEASNA